MNENPTHTLPAIDARWIAQTFAFARKLTPPQRITDRWLIPGQAYGSVLRDPATNLWRMWYLDDPIYTEHFATSTDGLNWQLPDLKLNLKPNKGSAAPNAFMTSPQHDAFGRVLSGSQGPEGFCVLDSQLTPHPAARSRFTALYLARWEPASQGSPSGSSVGLCIAHSDDGIHWLADEHNAVIPGWLDTGNVFFYDQRIKKYVVYGRPNACVSAVTHANRLIGRYESDDLINWSPCRTVLDTDDLDASPMEFLDETALRSTGGDLTAAQRAAAWTHLTEGQTTRSDAMIRGRNRQWYALTVYPYADLYVGMAIMYDLPSGRMWIELVHSYDGIDWRREADRSPWIGGEADKWDYPMVVPIASPPVRVGDEDWFYYSATNRSHHATDNSRSPKHEGQPVRAMGVRKVLRDRLVGYEAGQREAELVTNMIPRSASISLNVEVASQGSVRVEICDAQGVAIPGCELDQCNTIKQSGLSQVVQWKQTNIHQLQQDDIRLRIVASHATIYAVNLMEG